MKFVDECLIKVKAGKGGNGVISFRREYRVNKGGPDGGDGGRGGSVFFKADPGLNTLVHFQHQKIVIGDNGKNGRRKKMYGHKGEDVYVKVPVGTLVYSLPDNLLHDIVDPQKDYLVARGGRGGRGNVKFKTTKNTTPRVCENGDLGENLSLKLVLKFLAHVGFVGKPSAGKSTLLGQITDAKPKIGNYPFTTLFPHLGTISNLGDKQIVIADLPGLIKDSHQGKGLGDQFLKHIERCQTIVHVLDFGDSLKNPLADYAEIQDELAYYSVNLINKKQIVVANKMDLPSFASNLQKFKSRYPKIELIEISALKALNMKTLKEKLLENQKLYFSSVVPVDSKSEVTITLPQSFQILNPYKGFFEVKGQEVEQIFHKIPLVTWENTQRFNAALKNLGVWEELRKHKINEGDVVRILSYEFMWGKE